VKRFIRIIWNITKWGGFLLLVFFISLFFREQRLPDGLVSRVIDAYAPTGIVIHVESVSVGFLHGIHLRNFRLHDRSAADPISPILSVDSLSILPLQRRIVADDLTYARLPESYYAPGNEERNAPVDLTLPDVPRFSIVLRRPDVLALKPELVMADVEISGNRVSVDRIRLDWPDKDEKMMLDGFCTVDFAKQTIEGTVHGSAKQHNIRPFIEVLDIPVALPYIDAFTQVRGKVPSSCSWKVNLVNNDFDMVLDLHPLLGKYNLVPMRNADGKIFLHVYTRGKSLNYRHTIGPISAKGVDGQPLDGKVEIEGLNGTNTVKVVAKSLLPAASLLKIGGFTGEYVGDDVTGESSCDLMFHFPRSMTNNYEVLNGRGSVSVKNGQVMRMKGFRGLMALLAERVPGVSLITDSTHASCDYTIENGVVKTDNVYIEGSVFSIKMYGSFDTVSDKLDFVVRVQFVRKDSMMGKILHPLTWPFTKLLLEFRLTGSAGNPEWEYISVIDRVVEAVK